MIQRIGIILAAIFFLSVCCHGSDEKQTKKEPETTSAPTKQKEAAPKFTECDEVPIVIKQVTPEYPDSARKAGVEGTVWLRILVNKTGKVDTLMVSKRKDGSAELEQAAQEAARQWTFKPAKANGQPVACWVSIPVHFKLDSKDEKQPDRR